MEEQGDLSSGGDGTEGFTGLLSHRPYAHTPTPCLQARWRQRAAYRGMLESCGVQGMAWVLPGPERAPGPERTTGKFPSLGQRAYRGLHRLLPRGLVLLTRARVLGRTECQASRLLQSLGKQAGKKEAPPPGEGWVGEASRRCSPAAEE